MTEQSEFSARRELRNANVQIKILEKKLEAARSCLRGVHAPLSSGECLVCGFGKI